MGFKFNLLLEVNGGHQRSRKQVGVFSRSKGQLHQEELSLLSEAHIAYNDFLRSAGRASRWLLSGSEQVMCIFITRQRPASSLKHVNIKRG